MKRPVHFSLSCIFILFLSLNAFAVDVYQTWTWTGNGFDGLWSTGANWDAVPSDVHQTYPHNYNDAMNSKVFIANVVFNGSASASVTGPYYINKLTISSGTVNLTSPNVQTLAIQGVATYGPSGFFISAGATLQISSGSSVGTYLEVNNDITASTIEGTLEISGTGTSGANASRLTWASDFSAPYGTVTVKSGGKILLTGTNAQVSGGTGVKLFFESGSTLEIQRNGGTIPGANYQSGSKILITEGGTTRVDNPAISTNSFTGDNNVIYNGDIEFNNSAGATGQGGSPNQWSLNANTSITGGTLTMKKGYLRLLGSGLNSPGGNIGAIDFPNVAGTAILDLQASSGVSTINIAGNVSMAGASKNLVINSHSSNAMTINIAGSLTQSGGTINFSTGGANGIVKVSGDVNKTGGTMTETSAATGSKLVFSGGSAQNATLAATISNDVDVEINKSANDVSLLAAATLPRNLILTARNITLGDNNLTVTNTATGGSLASHVVTTGLGTLTLKAIPAAGKSLPVGISTTSYDPAFIKNTTGTADFAIKVKAPGGAFACTVLNPANAINREWDITSASTSAIVELKPDDAVNTSPSPAYISHCVASVWDQQTSAAGSTLPYSATFTSFSPFIINGDGAIIPVELLSFKAIAKGAKNFLTWQTATEINSHYFDIERSANGVDTWTSIGTVKAAGKSQIRRAYSFEDNTPLSRSYYRLRSVDLDGSAAVSKIVSVNRSSKLKINKLSPMPVYTEGVNIDFQTENGDLIISLTDITGNILLTEKKTVAVGQSSLYLPLSNLAAGTYFLTVSNGQTHVVEKLIKP